MLQFKKQQCTPTESTKLRIMVLMLLHQYIIEKEISSASTFIINIYDCCCA